MNLRMYVFCLKKCLVVLHVKLVKGVLEKSEESNHVNPIRSGTGFVYYVNKSVK